VPVLLYQHLEVGKHERLVEQLAKISKLPVRWRAKATRPRRQGHAAARGHDRGRQRRGLQFAQGSLSQLITRCRPPTAW
jgi:chemotaxis response regulator CheB